MKHLKLQISEWDHEFRKKGYAYATPWMYYTHHITYNYTIFQISFFFFLTIHTSNLDHYNFIVFFTARLTKFILNIV